MDPIEFRIKNDTQVDPENPDRPFSYRDLIGCLRRGAETFGWDKRTGPAERREGNWMVGMGVAAAFRNNLVMPSGAKVKLGSDGVVTVETDMTDIGTGSYTIIAQTAAEMMGVSIDNVVVRLGDSNFPSRPAQVDSSVRIPLRLVFMLPASNSAKLSPASLDLTRLMSSLRTVRCVQVIAPSRLRKPLAKVGLSVKTRWSGAT